MKMRMNSLPKVDNVQRNAEELYIFLHANLNKFTELFQDAPVPRRSLKKMLKIFPMQPCRQKR